MGQGTETQNMVSYRRIVAVGFVDHGSMKRRSRRTLTESLRSKRFRVLALNLESDLAVLAGLIGTRTP